MPTPSTLDGSLPRLRRIPATEMVRSYKEIGASLERFSTSLPTIAVIVTTVDPQRRDELTRTLAEGRRLCEVERCERRVIQKLRLSPLIGGELAQTIRTAVELSKKIESLSDRAKELFSGGSSIPSFPGRLSSSDEKVLCEAMVQHRKRFWTALHMVPFTRQHALSQLDSVREGVVKASLVVFSKRSENKSAAQLKRHIDINARTVRGMLSRDDWMPGLINSAKIATLLIEVPLLAEKQILLLEDLLTRTKELRELHDRLTQLYGSLDTFAVQKDPDYQTYLARTKELGGGIEQAELQCRVFQALHRPYQRIKDYLVNANIGLVGKVVSSKEPHDELMQDGTLGLMRAVEKYDHETGYKLSTVAMWWITQSVHRCRPTYQNPIRLPVHQFKRLGMVGKADAQVGSLSHSELAEKLNLEKDVVEALRLRLRGMRRLSSVDEESPSLGERIEDYRAEAVLDVVEKRELGDRIRAMLVRMEPRSAEVLRLRFGLDGDPLTLEQIAQRFSVTRERIRQIEAKALNKVRSGHLRKSLEGFVD